MHSGVLNLYIFTFFINRNISTFILEKARFKGNAVTVI